MTNYNTKGHFSVAPEYRSNIPEARDITWDDAFFQNDDDITDIVAVFDFDYDQMISFFTQVKIIGQIVPVVLFSVYSGLAHPYVAIIPPLLYILSLAPCFLRAQVRWQVYAQHLAVTRDGIRYVNDRQKSCWGLSICDRGKSSKTVPFDKITDCDIEEPAGNTCLCVPNVLVTVNVDTASSGGEARGHELVISGLKNAHSFKRLVWTMKRAKDAGGVYSYRAPTGERPSVEMMSMESRGEGVLASQIDEMERGCAANGKDIACLLQDIRDELRQNNALLREQHEKKLDPVIV